VQEGSLRCALGTDRDMARREAGFVHGGRLAGAAAGRKSGRRRDAGSIVGIDGVGIGGAAAERGGADGAGGSAAAPVAPATLTLFGLGALARTARRKTAARA
jgi:hypothetical protein